MLDITIVKTRQRGGPEAAATKLVQGLRREGYRINTFTIRKDFFSRIVREDLGILKRSERSDALVYLNSLAGPSHYLTEVPRIGLFLHGFVEQEASHNIKNNGNFRSKLDEALLLTYWKRFNKMINNLDFIITRSYTTYDVNGIERKNVLLPQFIFPEEIESSKDFLKRVQPRTEGDMTRIVVYTSFADSPKLLRPQQIQQLSMMLKRRTPRRFSITVIDPKGAMSPSENIEVLRFLPKERFKELLASSDIYLDSCIDEEFRNVVLDAGLLKVPVAKITAPRYWARQDYSEDDVIIARSMMEMADKITRFINDRDECRPRFGKAVHRFINRKRKWEHVKRPLIDALKGNI